MRGIRILILKENRHYILSEYQMERLKNRQVYVVAINTEFNNLL